MSFHISELFQNQTTISNQNNASSVQSTAVNPQSTSGGNQALSNMMPGSTVAGQIVSAENGNVTVKLADSSYVTAALKGDIPMQPGSQVSFLVSSNHNNQVTLSPLFTNLMASSPSVENALNAASLPVNESTAAMVTKMMEQGMGIDKESLLGMYKQVSANPNIDSGVVVRLAQMNLAVNEMNAEQLKAYDNLNHQIAGSIEEIAKGLQEAFSDLTKTDSAGAEKLFGEVTKLLSESAYVDETTSDVANKNGEMNKADVAVMNSDVVAGNTDAVGQGTSNVPDSLVAMKAEIDQTILSLPDSKLSESVGKEDLQKLLQTMSDIVKQPISEESLQSLNELAKGNLSDSDALDMIKQFMSQNDAGSKLLSEPAIGKMLQNALQENWLLKPEDVADKEKMTSFYEQLKTQTAKLSEVAGEIAGKESPITQSANQLSNNIDFMNQLNQAFTYVQIPLKMSGQNANGDLYVYTNKKNLSANDGSVSAYLHLDMDHLGSVDCYVTMESQKVSTNFKVADDDILTLIEQNIDLLNERLEKRGYSLKSTVAIAEDTTSVVEEIEKELGAGSVPISKVSFDARA